MSFKLVFYVETAVNCNLRDHVVKLYKNLLE